MFIFIGLSRLTSQSMELIANNFVLYMHFIVSGIFMMACFATHSHRLLSHVWDGALTRLQFNGRYMLRLEHGFYSDKILQQCYPND